MAKLPDYLTESQKKLLQELREKYPHSTGVPRFMQAVEKQAARMGCTVQEILDGDIEALEDETGWDFSHYYD